MRLEPVAKCGPQHAGCSPRRATFHNKMFAIKKISRIPAVERKWLEPRERGEDRGGPFPAIAQHVVYAESAAACRKRIHGHRIPAGEIKITETRIGLFAAPRVLPFGPALRAICGAVPLLFGGKRFPRPARVCHGLRMTHVHWPVQR